MADRRVFDAQVLADLSDDHLARVDPHPHRETQPLRSADLDRVGGELALQRERRPARALRVVLVRDRRAEQRHDAVAGELVHRALEAVNAVAEDREEAIHDRPPQLRVGLLGQIHRADHVGEQDRDLLALTIEIGPRVTDLVGQVLGGVGARVTLCRRLPSRPRLRSARRREPPPASGRPHASQNLLSAGILRAAIWAATTAASARHTPRRRARPPDSHGHRTGRPLRSRSLRS